ncbi:MAG: hypothetical protein QME79_14620 [Bacillota bacterium]|nr:hypothetical protein [Bacillota bacterium]
MGLHVYLDAACTQQVSEGTELAPWAEDLNGTDGETKARQLWLKNDNNPAGKTFEDVVITAQGDTAAINLQFALDVSGSPGTWAESITMPNGDYLTAAPFWARVVVASGTPEQNVSAADTKVTAKQFAV